VTFDARQADRPAADRPGRPLLRTLLGEALRRTRLDQGRTLADVAGQARVSLPYLSEVERGRKEASSEILAAVCEALGVELAEVLDMVGADLASIREQRAEVIRLGSIGGHARGGYPAGRPGLGQADARAMLAA